MAVSSPSYKTLHIVYVPLLSPGHLIPMIDMAMLIASRGVASTVFLPPLIAARYRPSESESIPIRFVQIPFPAREVGLPEGCESVDRVPSNQSDRFVSALKIWQTSVEHFIEQMESLPTCMITDRFIPQVAGIAERLGLRRIIFDGMGCFSLFIIHQIEVSKVNQTVSGSEPFTVPGLPDEIVLTRKQLPGFVCPNSPSMVEYCDKIREADRHAYGILINSFDELEPDYIQELRKIHKNRAWCIGPLSLRNKKMSEKATRGNKATIDETQCQEWLDKQDPASVIYVCLGSLSKNMALQQQIELGRALEASNRPFIWVLNATEETKGEVEKWLSERTPGKGLLIWGWSPQVVILSHRSVGAFVTHCGWNSIMEGISSGVPFIAWPLFGEQFFNEKLISHVLNVGVSLEPNVPISFAFTEEDHEMELELITSDKILQAMEKVMGGDHKAMEIRKRAKELSEMAKRATEEGGWSWHNITLFLDHMAQPQNGLA